MLGRLQMTTKEALEQYNIIAGRVFCTSNKKWLIQDGTFKATTLEQEIKRVVATKLGGGGDATMLDSTNESGMGAA